MHVRDVIHKMLAQSNSDWAYYGYFFLNAHIMLDSKLPAIAGVGISNRIMMYVNPEMFEKLSFEEQVEVFRHEAEHIFRGHTLRMANLCDTKAKRTLMNLAQDVLINEPLKALHKIGWSIEKLNEEFQVKATNKMTSEEIYSMLLQSQKGQQIMQNEKDLQELIESLVDDHSQFGEGDSPDEEQKAVIKEAHGNAKRAVGAGSVPSNIQSLVDEMFKAQVSWKNQFRSFMAKQAKDNPELTRMKRNRRYGTMFPGKTKKPELHVAYCIDTSGSVSDTALANANAEILAIASTGVKVTCIIADAVVQDVFEFDGRKPIKFSGRGGTAYQPAIDKAMELGVDAIVYCGDMDSADTPTDPKIPFIWLAVGNSPAPGNFGKVLRIQEGNGK